jgi:Sec-independent protein secretion pathway component TatC
MIFVTIAVPIVAAVLFFWLGTRYAYKTLLPIWLARMTQKEMADLAARAAKERPPG